MLRWINALALLLAGGCASTQNPLPNEGPTTLQVYERHLAGDMAGQASGSSSTTPAAQIALGAPPGAGLSAPSRGSHQALEDLQRDFQQVPNPEILGYVYPHLNAEMPIPGYYTAFPLYERIHYALPGEGLLDE